MKNLKDLRIRERIDKFLDNHFIATEIGIIVLSLFGLVFGSAYMSATFSFNSCTVENITQIESFRNVTTFEAEFSKGCPGEIGGYLQPDGINSSMVINSKNLDIIKEMTKRHEYCHYLQEISGNDYGSDKFGYETECYIYKYNPLNYV